MRKLIVSMFMSLDGVIEDPGWTLPYWNDEIARFKFDELAASDALLLGRVTAEMFAGAWPTPDHAAAMRGMFASLPEPGAFSEQMNTMRKHVASRTLAGLAWNGVQMIQGDLVDAVTQLKREAGRNIMVVGSASIARALTNHGLVDEFRLLVYPLVLGQGMRLFDASTAGALELVETRTFTSNVVHLSYRPAATPA